MINLASSKTACGVANSYRTRGAVIPFGRLWVHWSVLVLTIIAICLSTPSVTAETTSDPIASIVEQAQAEGIRVIILEPDGSERSEPAASSLSFGETLTTLGGKMVLRLGQVLATAPGQISEVIERVAAVSPNGSASWPVQVVLVTLLGFVTGHFLFQRLGRRAKDGLDDAARRDATESQAWIQGAERTALVALAGLAVEVMFGLLLPLLVFGAAPHTNAVISTSVEVIVVLRLASIFFGIVLAPMNAQARVVSLDDDLARRLHGHLRAGLIAEFFLVLPALLLLEIRDLPQELMIFLAIIVVGIGAAVASLIVYVNRGALVQLFAGRASGKPGSVATNAWIVIVAYFCVAWFVSSARLLLDYPAALGLVVAPLAGVMIYFLIWGIGILVGERIAGRKMSLARQFDEDALTESALVSRPRGWIDSMARMVGMVIAVIFVLNVWGVALVDPDGSVGFIGIAAVTLLLAYAAWTAIRSFFDRKIAEEIGDISDMEGDEGGGAGISRLGTLLPLARNVILFAVVLVALMVVLIRMGIDLAPLFAGAGILGLAIGFGAQTLIRDIFSGFFFLLDDAFRKGEYVETGSAKGTVEGISIRSMQLRHHNGPLHTIPFGEIQQLTNFSRDWVIMKLPLRVTLDTDPERVRKMVKKLGQELLEDPQVGAKFLQPLKSQGVIAIDNFGMVVRVKFMTKPGDQFITRRVVYAKLHDLFEREGIEFASRDVRIRMEQESAAAGEAARAAAAAAELSETVNPDDPKTQTPAGGSEER